MDAKANNIVTKEQIFSKSIISLCRKTWNDLEMLVP